MKVSEDDSVTHPSSVSHLNTGGTSPAPSETPSHPDVASEPAVGSPPGPPPPGMQYAEQNAGQPAAVTAGYSGDQNDAEQLLLKLESLQIAEGLSAAGTYGQKARVAEEAFAKAVQCLEQGDVATAVNLLKVAHTACPTDKPQAQARIILLLGRCQQMTGPAQPATAPASVAAKPSTVHSQSVLQSVPETSYMQPLDAKDSTEAAAGEPRQDKDMRQADEAFQGSLEALNR